jgi:hypothetical protein
VQPLVEALNPIGWTTETGLAVGIKLRSGVQNLFGEQKADLHPLRRFELAENLMLQHARELVANRLMDGEPRCRTKVRQPVATPLSVSADGGLERVLEVVAEGQVAEVVKQGGQAQTLLDQQGVRPTTVRDSAARAKALPVELVCGPSSRLLVHAASELLEDCVLQSVLDIGARLFVRVANCRGEETRREVHGPEAVTEPDGTNLREDELRHPRL